MVIKMFTVTKNVDLNETLNLLVFSIEITKDF